MAARDAILGLEGAERAARELKRRAAERGYRLDEVGEDTIADPPIDAG
jgi:hypothetical protein